MGKKTVNVSVLHMGTEVTEIHKDTTHYPHSHLIAIHSFHGSKKPSREAYLILQLGKYPIFIARVGMTQVSR